MSDSFIIKGNPPVIISTNLEFFCKAEFWTGGMDDQFSS